MLLLHQVNFSMEKYKKASSKKGFTLLELMIVIVILGVLTTLISGNFLNSLKRGRDTRRKADLQNIQKALELFYEDKKAYPTFNIFATEGALCETQVSGSCASSEKAYMQKVPADTTGDCDYLYVSDGTQYQLYSTIENAEDQGQGVIQSDNGGYASTDCGCGVCEFGVSSSNTTP